MFKRADLLTNIPYPGELGMVNWKRSLDVYENFVRIIVIFGKVGALLHRGRGGSSCEPSVVTWMHARTYTSDLSDKEWASLQ